MRSASVRKERRGEEGDQGVGDLQGLRCVERAGGEMSWQPSQTILVCSKSAVMMGSDAAAQLLLVLTVGVFHHSGNGLLVCFSYSLTSFVCCFLDLLCLFLCCSDGFELRWFGLKCQRTGVELSEGFVFFFRLRSHWIRMHHPQTCILSYCTHYILLIS